MKIAIYGTGKMGRAIEEVAVKRGHTVGLKVNAANAGAPPTGMDLAIEFSKPDQALANMQLCLESGVPVVVGTTGWYEQLSEVKAMVERTNGTLLWASNFSIGVNLFFRLNKYLTQLMDPQTAYTARLDEIHHIHKLDAPSGTALKMGEVVAAAVGRDLKDCAVYAREGITGERDPSSIGFATVRGGDIVGDHTVLFAGTGERVEIRHQATSRANFAQGSLRAARFLASRATGLYGMDAVLGLN